jgi:hypothetical protein
VKIGAIPDDLEFIAELTGPEYGYNPAMGYPARR